MNNEMSNTHMKIKMNEENENVSRSNPTLIYLSENRVIPIDNLSCKYISSCTNVNELEDMLKFFRAGKGLFSDLQKKVEERLSLLCPDNIHLRALTNHNSPNEEWNSSASDISMENQPKAKDPNITDVWNCYYNPEKKDTGCEKGLTKLQAENNRLNRLVQFAEKLSETEKMALADLEKNRGNDYYTAKDYKEAEKYYSASIAICPTFKAYNNRAACHIKQYKFASAIEDANSTLALEPNNIKALYRRGLALRHQNKLREAMADVRAVLKLDPDQQSAKTLEKELRELLLALPSPVRIMTDEGLGKPKRIVEIDSKKLDIPNDISNSCYQVNEWGLPKVVCECRGNMSISRPSRALEMASRPSRNDRKQCKYANALEDADITLAEEPENIKALFERGVILHHQNRFKEALADMTAVLKTQPNHLLAQHIVKELRQHILQLLYPDRALTEEDLEKLKTETGEVGLHVDYISEANLLELPEVLCHCLGGPRFIQLNPRTTQAKTVRKDYASQYPKTPRISELTDKPEPFMLEKTKRLKITEVEKVIDESVEAFFMPIQCIVDKRSLNHSYGSISNQEKVNSSSGDIETPNVNKEVMEEEKYEKMYRLLGDLLEDVEPKV